MRSYLNLALKVLTRRKFFTFISLFGITLTLVVLVVATAVLDDTFAAKGQERRFDRALVLYRVMEIGPSSTMSMNPGYGFLEKYVLNLPGIERATAFSEPGQRTIYHHGVRIDTRFKRADANFWKVLDFEFLEGRPFTADEESRGAFVAVITDDLRDRLFGGGKAAGKTTGKTVEIDGSRYTIIGVVPAVPVTRRAAYSEIWAPTTTTKSSGWRTELLGTYNAVVLLNDAGDRSRVKQAFADVVKTIPVTGKEFTTWKAGLDTVFEATARDMFGSSLPRDYSGSPANVLRTVLVVLAVMFMTLPALNLITLNLSRILERAPEIGVRKAFGAPRRSLVWQFVLENVLLALIGGLIAFFLAAIVLGMLNGSGIIPHSAFSPNLRVFGYGMLVAAFFGVFSGAYPAWRMSRLNPVNALRGGAA
ncbi:MAG TPA: ABC transporter permease [Thermoanaerobaculia bacterium]|nr:ABC transporter permease [Thermoanaerobaculia bacterium]